MPAPTMLDRPLLRRHAVPPAGAALLASGLGVSAVAIVMFGIAAQPLLNLPGAARMLLP